jgi:hypothetical protein
VPVVALLAAAGLAVAGCSTGSGSDSTATGAHTTPADATSVAPAPSSVRTVTATTRISAAPSSSAAAIPTDAVTGGAVAGRVLAALAETDPTPYTQSGGVGLPGVHFTTPDRAMTCMFGADIQQCYYLGARKPVFGRAFQCPAQKGKDPLQGDVVGWGSGLVPLGSEPVTCVSTGEFPYKFGESTPLPAGRKLTMNAGNGTKIQCGNRDQIIVCASGAHGFAASVREYVSW